METGNPQGIGAVALPLLLVVTACVTTKAGQAEYDRQDRFNELLPGPDDRILGCEPRFL
jgi:hypothetical protein